ncbi:MAG TPA: hypothetical protein VMZ69_07885 [Saprospiraceae bacterium]|nr:hypothetical protein [Saprospiraceae bacterium]
MKLTITLLFISLLQLSYGQDRIFTYTYQSTVLNKGQREIEIWNTLESGKDDFYRRLSHRVEYEIGLGGNIQTAFYLNLDQKFDQPVSLGFSNEWKWKLSDPVASPIGLALYGELTLEPHETEVEGKILVDKQTGEFLHAVNLVFERGWEKAINGDEIETEAFSEAQFQYALAYRIKPGFHLGIETILRNEWAPEHEYSNLFAGPCFSFAHENFWINGTFLPQIKSLYSADETNNGLDLIHHTKLEARVIFSFIL